MKLNFDCMRDVLLEAEKLPLSQSLSFSTLLDALDKKYSRDDIIYSCIKLDEAGYISARIRSYDNNYIVFSIEDITIAGHELLNTIRSDSVWNKTKEKAKVIGVESIHAFVDIAKTVAAALIQSAI